MRVDAIVALKRGDKSKATEYLRFVEQHRGRAVAEQESKSLAKARTDPALSDIHLWPANGYRAPKKTNEQQTQRKRTGAPRQG